ncbi:MAG: hypothetical protein RIS64_4575 [Bacteroidota bacterium]|jgi:peptidoglycan hydrolase CwlO-like protein
MNGISFSPPKRKKNNTNYEAQIIDLQRVVKELQKQIDDLRLELIAQERINKTLAEMGILKLKIS